MAPVVSLPGTSSGARLSSVGLMALAGLITLSAIVAGVYWYKTHTPRNEIVKPVVQTSPGGAISTTSKPKPQVVNPPVVLQNVELNPIPWADVLVVKKASGEVLKVPGVPGQTPLRLSLPPGDYVIEVKDPNRRVQQIPVKVEPGSPAQWHDTLPGFDPDKVVNELLK